VLGALDAATTGMLREDRVQQAMFTAWERFFVISALPGRVYRVRLTTKPPGWFLEVREEPQEANGVTRRRTLRSGGGGGRMDAGAGE